MESENPSLYGPEFFAAWETFADEIKLVFQYGAQEAKTRPIAVKQTQYVLANMAIAKLLRDVGQPETAAPFHILAEALQDLVEGVSHPLFKIEKIDKSAPAKRGRQNDTSETWRVRASICIGIQYLIAGELDQDKAVAFVVRKYKMSLSKLLRPGSDLKSSISTWLKSFATDEVSNEVALSSYKAGIQHIEEILALKDTNTLRELGAKLIEAAACRAAHTTKI
jgi:hypothetical protein